MICSPFYSGNGSGNNPSISGYCDASFWNNPADGYTVDKTKGNNQRIDVVGALIGVARYVVTDNNFVINPDISVYDMAQSVIVGGMVGYNSGWVYMFSGLVSGGNVTMGSKPYMPAFVELTNEQGVKSLVWQPSSQTYSSGQFVNSALGGLVGYNYHSMILNSGAETDVTFDQRSMMTDDLATDLPVSFMAYPPGGYNAIGGLVGSTNDLQGIRVCLVNDYSSSKVNILTADKEQTENLDLSNVPDGSSIYNHAQLNIGGVAGWLIDTSVNTYFRGEIAINGQKFVDGMSNQLGDMGDDRYYMFYSGINEYTGEIAPAAYHSGQVYSTSSIQRSGPSNDINKHLETTTQMQIGQLFGLVSDMDMAGYQGTFTMKDNYYVPYSDGSYFDVGQVLSLNNSQLITAPSSNATDMLQKMQSGDDDVVQAIVDHLSGYTDDPAVLAGLIDYAKTRSQGWTIVAGKNNGWPVLNFQTEDYLPALVCKPAVIPGAPNTGRKI
jgi:hypothetical protein